MALSVRDKHISVPATQEGMKEAANWLMRWKDKIQRNAEKLLAKMLQEGEQYALNYLGHIDTGETLSTIASYREGNHGILLVGGNAIWIEFGTGVVANQYNPYPHHKAQELGMNAIGTYGKGHGHDPNGWWYMGDDGEYHHTYGIPANMFFYNTAQTLKREYDKYAKEIFK